MDRLLLVTYSPRVPAGALSWPAWEALRSGPVYTSDDAAPQARAVRAAGIDLHRLDPGPDAAAGPADDRASALAFRAAARGGTAVWLAGPEGAGGLAGALGDLLTRERPVAAELEIVYGSWDPPGARLLDVVAVMDRLRSPGGCPWDAEQTHASLAQYLLEEAYETVEAIEEDDPDLLREELGDVLLQVVFHARLAEERPDGDRWTVDDVAGGLVEKLIRRHPHVFAGRSVSGSAEVDTNWDLIKAAEKQRASVTDGVPLGQPALALAAKLQQRAEKAGLAVAAPATDDVGGQLFDLVARARAAGVDPEAALRAVVREFRVAIRAAEQLAGAEPRGAGEPAGDREPVVDGEPAGDGEPVVVAE